MSAGSAACSPHVVHVLPWPNIGGTEIATKRLIEAASAHGCRATVLHRSEAVPVRDMFLDAGVPAREYDAPEPSYRHAARYVSESRALARTLQELNADLVHCADVGAAFQSALAARIARVPLISHVRNRYRNFERRLRPVLGLVDHFAFVSRQTWKEFAVRVPPHRGSVLYDGIALRVPPGSETTVSVRRELGIGQNVPLVGMVARVARQKDLETLARAAAAVLRSTPDAFFLVVGDHDALPHREYYAEIRRLLNELGVDRFAFTGHRTDVQTWLAAFDIFVLSTHWEGFPLVILEAMAAGLPVVATSVDGIPEVVSSGETGFLVPPRDEGALATAIERLAVDPALRTRMGTAARARIAADFSEERYRTAVGALYRRLLPAHQQLAS